MPRHRSRPATEAHGLNPCIRPLYTVPHEASIGVALARMSASEPQDRKGDERYVRCRAKAPRQISTPGET